MLFNSFSFLIFFPIVLAVYFVVPKKTRYIWLLVVSYYFYMSWNPKYAALIGLSTVITYLSGILMAKVDASANKEADSDAGKRRIAAKKWIVAGSFLTNLGILFFFKYFVFALANLNAVLSRLHIEVIDKPFDVLLPVGISFYTFQALSYTVDVQGRYQGRKKYFPLRTFCIVFSTACGRTN